MAKNYKYILLLIACFLLFAVLVSAQTADTKGKGDKDTSGRSTPLLKDIDAVAAKLCDVFKWVFTFALGIGTIYIVLAAFKYFSAGGDSNKVGEAHKALLYGVIGITVAILSEGVPLILADFLGSDISSVCP